MKAERSFENSSTCKLYMRFMFAVAMCAASLFAAPQQNFATDVEAYLAAHKIAGVESFQGLLKVMGEPCGAAASIDATVLPKHKARKVRLWGIPLLPVYKSWGLDVAEFDPEAAAQGDLPDVVVIAIHSGPDYSKGLVDAMFRAAAEGVHVISLCPTDQWSAAIAQRLGFTYGGVLTIGPAEKGGALIPNCPKLFEGFPAKARLNAEFGAIAKVQHGMYLTYDTCLMCVADAGKGCIASAIADRPPAARAEGAEAAVHLPSRPARGQAVLRAARAGIAERVRHGGASAGPPLAPRALLLVEAGQRT